MQGNRVVIVGAGKIGRGFIAHLLWMAAVPFTFVESRGDVVEGLRAQGRYRVEMLGHPEQSAEIDRFEILAWPQAGPAVAEADTIFTAVGGNRLTEAGQSLAPLLALRQQVGAARAINIVTCENWPHPAAQLRQALVAERPGLLSEPGKIGIAEATVLRSCIEPTPEQAAIDPFTVQAQSYWELQIDRDALVAPLPAVSGFRLLPNFQTALSRKLYTYNAASATLAFLGLLAGHRYLHEAAGDPRVLAMASAVLNETGRAVCQRYGYTEEEQRQFADSALAKYSDPNLPDPLERQVRDPLRKLGPHDRLVGAASLCQEAGIVPRALALVIAAGLRYAEPSDPSARALQAKLGEDGVDAVLTEVCGIDPMGQLAHLIRGRIPDVDRFIRGETVM